MAKGAPDYQRVFTLVPPSMTHGAPDWQRTAVGPGGAPVSGITLLGQLVAPTAAFIRNGVLDVGTVTLTNTEAGYAMLAFALQCEYSITTVPGEGFTLLAGGDLTSYVSAVDPQIFVNPGVIVTNAVVTVNWCGLVYLTNAAAFIELALSASDNCTGTAIAAGGPCLGVWQ